jgi:glycosyltransferase involved in cell wall biosynthesis
MLYNICGRDIFATKEAKFYYMKKLFIIFEATNPGTLGNASRLDTIKYLARFFDIIVYTNQVKFIQEYFPGCLVMELPSTKKLRIPILNDILRWCTIAGKINKNKCDGVFMFYSTSPVTLWVNKPVIQYIQQYGRRSEINGIWLKNAIKCFILGSIREYLIIQGLKKSIVAFVISKPIMDMFRKKGVNNLMLTSHAIRLEQYQRPKLLDSHLPLKHLKEEGFFLITYTGWVIENRGFMIMLQSLKEAVRLEKKIALIVAGADQDFSMRMADFCRQYNLEKNIVNLGIVDAAMIPGILYYSNVCLSFLDPDVPAYQVSPPQKVIEYFAAGRPVICNKIATHEWLIEHGHNGFILEYDPCEVADHIIKLKNDSALYDRMAKNALKASESHSIESIYGKMVEAINDALNAC